MFKETERCYLNNEKLFPNEKSNLGFNFFVYSKQNIFC